MKKQLLLFVAMLLPMVAMADAVEIDGIYYNLISKTKAAEVTSSPNKYQGSIVIPETVNYDNVTYSVTSIGNYAFGGCYRLTSVTIPNSVTSIGEDAFYYCSGLTSITIGNSVTSIGNEAFFGCSGLTSINIPNSVTSISSSAFKNCYGLTSITIPNSVTSIGYRAFYECSGLTSVTIPNSVTSIGNEAFYHCSGLTSITIPNSVTSIGWGAFYYCSGLTSITIGNSVTSIGNEAFFGCSALTSVTIPNSVTSIGDYAFRDCSRLSSAIIGNSVTSIGGYAFYGCSGLTSVTIPNSVTSIGNYAFQGCSGLTSVTIGSGIKSIWTQAFAKCSELTDVYCLAENVPNTKGDAFSESYIDYATLHVPDASIDSYKATEPWSGFKVVVGLNGETPDEPEKCAIPTISYQDGKLTFTCATEGAEFISEITDADIKKHYDASISLTATYNISVFAMKTGYDNSDVATATLVWLTGSLNADDVPTKVGAMRAQPVLIKRMDGRLIIEGADAGTRCYVYTTDGKLVKEGITASAPLTLELPTGCIYILKVGTKTLKVAL